MRASFPSGKRDSFLVDRYHLSASRAQSLAGKQTTHPACYESAITGPHYEGQESNVSREKRGKTELHSVTGSYRQAGGGQAQFGARMVGRTSNLSNQPFGTF